jgi:hypothetical protein
MDPPAGEAGLILVLAGSLCLHHWERLLGWLPSGVSALVHVKIPPVAALAGDIGLQAQTAFSLSEGPLLSRMAIACLALALPAGLWLLVRNAATYLLPGRARPWLVLYALLPLLWSVMLAHHLALGMAEGGRVLVVSLAPWLGGPAASLTAVASTDGWVMASPVAGGLPRPVTELLGQLPSWSADPHVIGFCQSLAVGLGLVGSVVLLRRLLLPDRLSWLLQAAGTLVLALTGRWLVAVG